MTRDSVWFRGQRQDNLLRSTRQGDEVVANTRMGGLWWGVGQLKRSWLPGKAEVRPAMQTGRQAASVHHNSPRQGGAQPPSGLCSHNGWERVRERNGIHRNDRWLVSGLGGSTKGLRFSEGTGISRTQSDLGRPKGVCAVWGVAPYVNTWTVKSSSHAVPRKRHSCYSGSVWTRRDEQSSSRLSG